MPRPRTTPVDVTDSAALDGWRRDLAGRVDALLVLARDAAAPRGERRHSRRWLRSRIARVARELGAMLGTENGGAS